MEELYLALLITMKAYIDLMASLEDFKAVRVRRKLEFLNKAMELEYQSPAMNLRLGRVWMHRR